MVNAKDVLSWPGFFHLFTRTVDIKLDCGIIYKANLIDYKGNLPATSVTTFTPPPEITSIDPSTIIPGVTTIKINGYDLDITANFLDSSNATASANGLLNADNTQNTVLVPSGLLGGKGTLTVQVGNNGAVSNAVPINVAGPIGFIDDANCSVIDGWAYDSTNPSSSIAVHVYKDGPAGMGTFVAEGIANLSRPDINTALGISGNHGFSFTVPNSLKDRLYHSIWVHGIASSKNYTNLVIQRSGFVGLRINCAPTTSTPTPIPTTHLLTVTVAGAGSVTGGADTCGANSTCSKNYPTNTSVTLTATPASGKTFKGWGGDCASFGTSASCSGTMNVNRNVTASFQ
jgi:hypothetical protein